MSNIYDKSSLVLIPSGTKTGKIFSQKPVSGDGDFTFTRASAATRVNADGNIEKETQNLLTNSQNLADSQYVLGPNMSRTTGQTDPNGGNTAVLFSNLSDPNGYFYSSVSLQANTINTFSIYIKGASAGSVSIRIDGGATGTQHNVNYTTEWTRVSCYQVVGQTNCQVVIGGFNTWTAGQNIQFAFAQVEQGLVARDYIETTTAAVYGGITDNTPRLDYTDSSCPALLLEPQRTNLVTQSEYLGDWTLDGGTQSITSNYAISPEGIQNATRAQFDKTGVSYSRVYLSNSGTTSGVDYVFSVYLKANSGSPVVYLQVGPNFSDAITLTNDWQRYEVSGAASGSSTSVIFGVNDFVSGTTETADILVYGAQMEEATYPTSYIPTYGSSVSRVAEASLKTGVADLINDGDGTLYMEVTPTNFEGDQRFGISDNIGANRIVLRLFNPSSFQLSCVINSSVQVSIANSGYSAGNTYKIAGAWKNNDAVIYINGVQVATDTNCNITPSNPLTRISFDNGVGTAKWENPVSQTLYFPTRLSNAELAALTTI